MNICKFTNAGTKNDVYINPDHIVWFDAHTKGTSIRLSSFNENGKSRTIVVAGEPHEIENQIYKGTGPRE